CCPIVPRLQAPRRGPEWRRQRALPLARGRHGAGPRRVRGVRGVRRSADSPAAVGGLAASALRLLRRADHGVQLALPPHGSCNLPSPAGRCAGGVVGIPVPLPVVLAGATGPRMVHRAVAGDYPAALQLGALPAAVPGSGRGSNLTSPVPRRHTRRHKGSSFTAALSSPRQSCFGAPGSAGNQPVASETLPKGKVRASVAKGLCPSGPGLFDVCNGSFLWKPWVIFGFGWHFPP